MASSTQQSGFIAETPQSQQTATEEDLTLIAKLTPINLEGLCGGRPAAMIDQDQLTNQNSLRKQSMDSMSSYTSNEVKQLPSSETKIKKSKQMMIKKKEFKVQTAALNFANNLKPTGRVIAVDEVERSSYHQFSPHNIPQIVGGVNQQYTTDPSDSELSVFETQSIGSAIAATRTGGTIRPYLSTMQPQFNGMMNTSMLSNINCITPVSTSRVFNFEGELLRLQQAQEDAHQFQFLNKLNPSTLHLDPYHPFADKLSPFDEWKQILVLALETTKQFIVHDIFLNGLYFIWSCFMYTLLLPIGGIGLMVEYMRVLKNKCCKKRDEVDPFIRVAPPKASDKIAHLQDQQDKREAIEAAMFRKQQESLSPIRMPEGGDFIFVVDLDHTLVYSQPIKSQIDSSRSQINDSFVTIQSLNLELNGGGHYKVMKRPYVDRFLKRMSEMGQLHIFTAATKSYAEPVIDMIDPKGYITGRYYREHCKTDKNGNFIKPMDIITTNFTRLIIIDDSDLVYNMYKENTIKISQWIPNANAGKKQDKKLLDCIQIVEQLNCVTKFKDVRQNLRNIIDTENKYRE